jgi:hypothetical protein
VCRHANGAGSGLCEVGVIVGRLRRRCPQHQGQAEPRRPSQPESHQFPVSDLDSIQPIKVIHRKARAIKLL